MFNYQMATDSIIAVNSPTRSCLGNHEPGLHTRFQQRPVDAAGWVKILVCLGPGNIEATVELQDQTSVNCTKEEKTQIQMYMIYVLFLIFSMRYE